MIWSINFVIYTFTVDVYSSILYSTVPVRLIYCTCTGTALYCTLKHCVFVMIYKNKGSSYDCAKYRVIGLLKHGYKIMSVVLLKRSIEECGEFFSD